MNLSQDALIKLMAYVDGELAGDDKREVEALLAQNIDALRFVTDLSVLGTGVALALEPRTASFDVADAVMAKAATTRQDAKTAPKASVPPVASLAKAREKRASRAPVVAGVVAVLALAASLFLVARPKEAPVALSPGPAVPVPRAVTPDTSAGALAVAETPAPASSGEVEVEAVDSPTVSVFYLPSANELSTSVVVWVDETGESK